MLTAFKGNQPAVGDGCFLAENAVLIGDVRLGDGCSVWFGAVLRGDLGTIAVGEKSNIQDNAVLHCDPGFPISIGKLVTVGHGAIVHGAAIEDRVIIGMGAVVMNGVHIGADSVIGAGALITEGTDIPAGSVAVGVPAKIIKTASERNRDLAVENAGDYAILASEYLKNA